jgi:hypothetical protein
MFGMKEYHKKCLQHLTRFLISICEGDCKNMLEIELLNFLRYLQDSTANLVHLAALFLPCWPVLKKSSWELNFLHIISITLLNRHDKRC